MSLNVRSRWSILSLIAILLCRVNVSTAAELSDQEILKLLNSRQPREKAINKALTWMRSQQQTDGSLCKDGHKVAMTSLGIMAHLSAGVSFNDAEHGEWLQKSLRYVLKCQDSKGYYGSKDNSRMYGHGITTLMLAEALGMVGDAAIEEELRLSLERAVQVTVNAAKIKKPAQHAGGWRYTPTAADSDLSLSGWQLMSLHAAQQVGIVVPKEIIANAVKYAKQNTTKDGKVGYQGASEHGPTLRGLGMLCLTIGGKKKDPLVSAIKKRILAEPIKWQGSRLFYQAYYDSVGMSRGAPEAWETYGPLLRKVLVEHQKKDGSWPIPPGNDEGSLGPVYLTSMAVLALAVDSHILPAYER